MKAFDLFISSSCQHEVFNIGGGPDNSLSLLELIHFLETKTGKSVEVKTSEWRKFVLKNQQGYVKMLLNSIVSSSAFLLKIPNIVLRC